MRSLFITAFLIFITQSGFAAELTIDVRGDNGASLGDAVVWAVPENPPPASPSKASAIMDQVNRMFVPHVLAVQVGASVRFPNSDNVRHQVYSFSPPKTFQLPLYIGEPAQPVVFDKPGVVALGCNIHDQMNAWIVVVDTPHFGKTSSDGRVKLTGLRAGRHQIHAWHPEMTRDPDPIDIELNSDSRKELTIAIRTR